MSGKESGNKETDKAPSGEETKESPEGATGSTETDKEKKPSLLDAEPPAQSTTEWLRQFFAKSLGISNEPEPEKLLDEVSIEGVARYILSDKCQKIVTMAGAGISTSAGIPDFRSPGTGLYDNLEKYDLPNPMAVFDIDYFEKNPEPFFMLAKELFPGKFTPTPCHYFLKLLNDKNKLLRHYTQNIDTLERVAGLPEEKLVEAHGTFQTSHCRRCEHLYTLEWMKERIMKGEVPKCEQTNCEGVVKPDIVFFGESLPSRFAQLSHADLSSCDMLIILGTSLVVQPFASLSSRVPDTTPRLYINLEKTGGGRAHPISVLMFGGGFAFDSEDNYRDVFWQGTCDDGCFKLAELLGWKAELEAMVKDGAGEETKGKSTPAKAKQDKKK